MSNRLHLLGAVALGAFALSSCGGGAGGGGDQAANKDTPPSSSAFAITPGEYETTVRITEANMSAFPADMQEGLRRAQEAGPQTQRGCNPISFSVDQIRYTNMRFSVPQMGPGAPSGGCNVSELALENGTIKGRAVCDLANMQGRPGTPTALNLVGTIDGTYGNGESTMSARADLSVPGQNQSGNVAVEIKTRRVGDCPPRPTYTPPPPTTYNSYTPAPSYNTYAPPMSNNAAAPSM